MIMDLMRWKRTVRQFQRERSLDLALLTFLIDPARLDGSIRNGQSLKFMVMLEARLAGHWEHKMHHVPKGSLSRIFMVQPVAV